MLYCLSQSPTILPTNKSAIDAVLSLHKQSYKILATSTDTPVSVVDEMKNAASFRNFVVLEFSNNQTNLVKDMLNGILNKPSCLIYHLNSKKDRLILELAHNYGQRRYKQIVHQLANQFNIVISPKYLDRVDHPIVMKPFDNKDIVLNLKGQGLDISVAQTNDSDNLAPDTDILIQATKTFLNTNKAKKILLDRSKVIEFFDAIIASYLKGMLNDSYLQAFIKMIAEITGYSLQEWQNLFNERMQLMKTNPSLQQSAQPFGAYIHLYSEVNHDLTLGQQLLASLPKGTHEDSDYELADAAGFIEMTYPPYLLDEFGDDEDLLVIFDPTKGVWTNDYHTLYSLLTAIRPYTKKQECDTFIMTFAAKARNANRFITPYHGSRYLLFKNCVLDVLTMKTLALDSPEVHDLHFTERCRIDVDYIANPPLPQLRGELSDNNGNWNPRDFLMGYANNITPNYIYLLFGLALGLFAGHNFGVHFDIKGQSRWGKTTLSEYFNKIFHYRVNIISFPQLNTQFPFTSYNPNNSIIWIKESNEGTDPLDDSNGTIIYDGLADNQVRFQVKSRDDLVLSNPPQVYIDGTQFIKARELYTGPAGRTLAFKLPTMTEALHRQIYAKNIAEDLHNTKVVQWIIYNSIMAYKEIVPESRIDDFKLNLGIKNDLSLLPPDALKWRKEFVVGGSTIDDWFENQIEPYLSTDPKKPTYLHPRVLYSMYLFDYKNNNPNDPGAREAKTRDEMMRRLKTVWDSEDDKYAINYNVGSKERGRKTARKRVKDPDHMNFDWKNFEEDFARPTDLQSPGYKTMNLFDKKATDWISIYIKPAPISTKLGPGNGGNKPLDEISDEEKTQKEQDEQTESMEKQ